ncbi:hypothetical protein [uncultured Methanomethylovorans sp.]|uniref:hypothetical protein n=1 Tax=uncultured Methanomethylovorans sp. TaxID=183759 RepID=UPI002AA70D60|nr:hypothetical protein [uncultured Methanomethylovorans sp.]
MKLVTYIAIVLMLTSLVSTSAFAANSKDVDDKNKATTSLLKESKNQDQEEEQNQVSLSGNNSTGGRFTVQLRETKEEYFAAKDKLQQINANINSGKINGSSKEVFEVKQEYLLETVNYTISNLEDLKENVDAFERVDADEVIADIDGYIFKLNAEKDNIGNATTTKELAESARTIRDIWKDAVKDAYKTRTKFVDDKVVLYLNKSVFLSERLSNEVATLRKQGENTTELEAMLQEYNGFIEQAQQNRERARETYQNGDENAHEYWSASAENLKDANSVLAEISQMLKTYRHGLVSLNGSDVLLAKGNGTAVLSGNLDAEMTITDSQLVIKDLAGDAKITITNDESAIVLKLDNSLADEPKRALVYSDLTGKVSISGSRLTIMVRGNDLDLEVKGTGNAVLSGKGTYTAGMDEVSKQWTSQFDTLSEEDNSQED